MPFSTALAPLTSDEAESAREAEELYRMVTAHRVSQTLRAAAELNVADHVADGAVTSAVVAERAEADPNATRRLLRACVALGVLSYNKDSGFGVTPLGQRLRAGVPGSLREVALVQGAPGHWLPWGRFPEAIRTGTSQAERALGMDIFEYYACNPAEVAGFTRGMTARTIASVDDIVALLDLDGAKRVVDVGGAAGALLISLLHAHPEIQGELLDLPHVVDSVRLTADQRELAHRFSVTAGDFFVSVPEADYYLLKWILHDWDDDRCVKILRNCRASAHAGARLLVVETLVGELGTPDPAALLDMNMLALSSGKERDLDEFDALFTASGWKRVSVAATHSSWSLIELELQ
ncbi:methyltransferase [Lentzea sp. NPDC059081]|uniref:methyltransferase n=1 Tax=Lentzea sp. NPDC059081 TaxID=3346719 RepID=UPI0036BF35C5